MVMPRRPAALIAVVPVAGAGLGTGVRANGSGSSKPASALVGPGDHAVSTAEAARRKQGACARDMSLPAATKLPLDGRKVTT